MRYCVIKLEGEQEKLQERCSRLEHANDALAGEARDLQQRLHDTDSTLNLLIGRYVLHEKAITSADYCAVRLQTLQGGLAEGSEDKEEFKHRRHPPISHME
ncbi:hypothetical protein J6590_021758 [Homalodisca vitripennis]|nr:hypothetical protein J6590_021758 [Homalodisca vitripennis]